MTAPPQAMAVPVDRHPPAEGALGPVEGWSPGLRAAADLVRAHALPMALLWGPHRAAVRNHAFCRLAGDAGPGDILRRTGEDVAALLSRIDAGETLSFEDVSLAIVGEGTAAAAWATVTLSPVREDAAVAGILVTLVDTTRLHPANERHAAPSRHDDAAQRLRTFVEAIPQILWRADADGAWTWASSQWLAYTALPEAASLGTGWLDAVHPEDQASIEAAWRRAAAEGEYRGEHRLRQGASGDYRWFQVRALPVRDEAGRIVEWLGTSTDVDDLARVQRRQRALLGELQHRVRNILTVVRSVFARTMEAEGPIEERGDHFRGRLDSLARTQLAVSHSAGGPVDLENLIRDELLSVGATDGPHLTIDGPEVALSPAAAETIGLAIHELTTNALKFGALKVKDATLAICWRTDVDYGGGHRLHLTWVEAGVPAIQLSPRRQGFGSELIEEALPYRLGAETSLEFAGGGVRCRISMPLARDEEV